MDLLCRIELPRTSGLVEDQVVNTFTIGQASSLLQSEADAVATAFATFFNNVPTGGLAALRDLLSPEIVRNVNVPVKFYDITGKLNGVANVGSPIRTAGFGIGPQAGASAGLPGEVACVLTLNGQGRADAPVEAPDGADADDLPDRPKQRRTGRIYFGPLAVNTLSVVDGLVRPGSNIRDTLRLAAADLETNIEAALPGSQWSVWSRKDAALYPIESVSTDNAFDTMRSRGPAATARGVTAV